MPGCQLRRWRASEGWAERRGETSASKGRGARQRSDGMGRLNAQGDELAKRAGLRRLREAMLMRAELPIAASEPCAYQRKPGHGGNGHRRPRFAGSSRPGHDRASGVVCTAWLGRSL